MLESIGLSAGLLATTFLFAISATGTPGPNNIMLLASGVNYGIRRTIPHGAGVIIGTPLLVAIVGTGLGQLFTHYPLAHQLIKVLGIGYLLYLAWKIIVVDSKPHSDTTKKPMTFTQAVLFQWVNPKAWVMSIGAVSAFTTANSPIYWQILVITLCFLLAAMTSTSIWICCGALIRGILQNHRQRKVFNLVMGGLLVATVLPMIKNI